MQIGLRLVISDTKQLGPRRLRLAGGSMEAWHGRVSATAELSVVRVMSACHVVLIRIDRQEVGPVNAVSVTGALGRPRRRG
jgi:hypothetical protein